MFKINIIFLSVIAALCAREIEIENYKPDSTVKSDNFFDFGSLRLKKISRNHFSLSGDFELFENCGNEKEMLLEIRDKRKNNKVIIKSEDKMCDFLKNDKLIWPDIQKNSNLPKGTNVCPLPKGKYSLNNYVIDEKKFALVPPSEYKARVAVLENGQILAAVDIDCTVKL